jgi:hypothetical protein
MAIGAYQEEDRDAAVGHLTAAIEQFDAAGMQLYAAVCRRRLGTLLAGEQGRTLQLAATSWMAAQEVRNPVAMTRLIAPGLPD